VQRQQGQRSSLQLSDVAAAVWAGMPQQQEQLASIKRRAAVTSTRLRWQVRPDDVCQNCVLMLCLMFTMMLKTALAGAAC
jgi:hypothetical protein